MQTITERQLMRDFGYNLRAIMEERRMSRRELADATGISKAAVSYYASGQRMPTLKTLVNLVNVLECDVEDLVNFDYFVE